MVTPRAENPEVFKKGWNLANRTCFASCIIKKHCFLLWTKETASFPYFYHENFFNSVELFDCKASFKFYFSIYIFLNINVNHTSKEQYLNKLISGSTVQNGVGSKVSGLQFHRSFILYGCFLGFWSRFSDLFLKTFS